MTDFTKTKITFVLALLGTLFTLHPLVDQFGDWGYEYLGVPLRVFHVFVAFSVLLALSVYFYALVLLSERPHSWSERTGNTCYALALMVLPLYGGLYSANLLADRVGHSHLAWAAPAVAVTLGVVWLVVSQLAAWMLRNHLSRQDRASTAERFASDEIASLARAREMFEHEHYDLSVIEAWRAVEARLRRVLLARQIACRGQSSTAIVAAATRAGVLRESVLSLVDELRCAWDVAVSVVPLSREAADSALAATRGILATISVANASEWAKANASEPRSRLRSKLPHQRDAGNDAEKSEYVLREEVAGGVK